MIDLCSDTVTWSLPAMVYSIMHARLGVMDITGK